MPDWRSDDIDVRLRREPFDRTLKAGDLPSEIVGAHPGDWTQDRGEAVCQNFIAANFELGAMSDEVTGGCDRAVEASEPDMTIFSVGGPAKGIDMIENGRRIFTLDH